MAVGMVPAWLPDKHSKKTYSNMPRNIREQADKAYKRICDNPLQNPEMVQGELSGIRSERFNSYRILYAVTTDHQTDIISLGHRKDVYGGH